MARQAAERDSGKRCSIPGRLSPYLSADGNHIVQLAPYAFCGSGSSAVAYRYVAKADPNVTAGDTSLVEPDDDPGLYAEYAEGHRQFTP